MAPPLTEGELWAREELRRLKAARYAPHAGARFIAASWDRARQERAASPSLARQADAWLCTGSLAWVALAVAGRQPYRRRIISGLAWWASVGAMLRWHLGMVETEDGAPRPLGPADALTLTRAWLVPAIADDLDPRRLAAAALTDVLDGTVARAGQPTRAGRDLEGVVDAAILLAALRAAARTGRLARPLIALEVLRLLAGTGYAAGVYFTRAEAPDATVTRAARRATPLRIAGLIAAGAGHRRRAHLLLAGGSIGGLAALARRARPC